MFGLLIKLTLGAVGLTTGGGGCYFMIFRSGFPDFSKGFILIFICLGFLYVTWVFDNLGRLKPKTVEEAIAIVNASKKPIRIVFRNLLKTVRSIQNGKT